MGTPSSEMGVRITTPPCLALGPVWAMDAHSHTPLPEYASRSGACHIPMVYVRDGKGCVLVCGVGVCEAWHAGGR